MSVCVERGCASGSSIGRRQWKAALSCLPSTTLVIPPFQRRAHHVAAERRLACTMTTTEKRHDDAGIAARKGLDSK